MDHESDANEPAEASATNGTDLASMIGDLGQSERLIVFGGALLILNYLFFELILREYFTSTVLLLVGGLVVAAAWIRHNRADASWPLPYEWLMRVMGFTAGFLGLIEALDDLRFDVLDESSAIIAGLILYTAVVMMFMGAKKMGAES